MTVRMRSSSRAARRATSDAFETLYRQHAARIYALASRMAGSPDEGEDLLQEIFLQAYRKLGSFKGDAALGTWLYRLALNHCLDFVRSRQAKMTEADRHARRRDDRSSRPRRETPIARIDLERASSGCRKDAAKRSCCTTSKDSTTRKSAAMLGSPKARRSRRCSRRG